jgi:glycosyltransferase involved in cell wall biosynthesis
MSLLKVTIAIPAYNEANYIKSVIRGFLNQNHPDLLEIIVADGGSQDGTQAIVKKIAFEDSRVKLLNNPLKIQSAGLNLIFENCQGDIFLRADAHSEYAPNYIEKCVKALEFSQALNVGGSQRHIARNTFQGGVTLAFRSFLAGTAKYHDPDYDGYADTVYLGCFLTKVLREIANNHPRKELFDTTQVTNQDAELNLKLLEISEKAIYISSDIKVWYSPRDNWRKLFIQYFKYGRGRYLTTQKHPKKAPLRTKVPVFFLIIYLLILMVAFYLHHGWIFLLLSIIGIFSIFLLETIRVFSLYYPNFREEIWRGEKDKLPNPSFIFLSCFISLIIMPTSYLLGNIYQRYRNKIRGINGW